MLPLQNGQIAGLPVKPLELLEPLVLPVLYNLLSFIITQTANPRAQSPLPQEAAPNLACPGKARVRHLPRD